MCAVGTPDVSHPAGPTLFRTYDVAKNKEYNCTIWEAARATSAAPTFFKRIKIGPPNSAVEYVDAALGFNNPIKEVIAEAARVFVESSQVSCMVSIGTGQRGIVGYDKPDAFQKWLPTRLVDVLKKIATDCDKTAQEMEQRFKNFPHIYYRLNVDRGLELISLDEWKRLGDVRHHTKSYMKLEALDRRVDQLVNALLGSPEHQTCALGRLGSFHFQQVLKMTAYIW